MNINLKTSLLAMGVAVLSSVSTVYALRQNHSTDTAVWLDSPSGNLHNVKMSPNEAAPDFVTAAENTVNGVVSIKSFATPRYNSYSQSQPFSDPFFEYFFGGGRQQPRQQPRNEEPRQTGLGSGVILSSDGYIVTNNHVVDGAEKLEVSLNDNQTFNATVVGTDPTTDLALIKIDGENLHVIPMGESDNLKVGEWVLAVGNPFGFTSTVTKGIVSAKARNISSITQSVPSGVESFIQTDAAVNPGNSGGALVNMQGELVGINTAIYSQTGSFAGYSFAIPTSIVKKVVTDLKQYGTVQRAILGVRFAELTPKLAQEKNITAVTQGIYVGSVEDRSAAYEAGLREGDVIVSIAGSPTNNNGQLQEEIAKHRPGDKVEIKYYRDNKPYTVTVTLRNTKGSTDVTRPADLIALGCAFKTVQQSTLRQLEISNGVQVVGLKDGLFKSAGIRDGLIITEINNGKITSPEDIEKIYRAILSSGPDYDKVMFITGVYPTGKKVYYAVDLSE